MSSSHGDRLRDAADVIGGVADDAPEGDFDPELVEEFEAEHGEVPSLRSVLRDLESTTRELSILADAHSDDE